MLRKALIKTTCSRYPANKTNQLVRISATPALRPTMVLSAQREILGYLRRQNAILLVFYLHALARSGSLIALHFRSHCFRSGTDRIPHS